MQYRKFGRTGWNVSVLGFGASPLGGAFGPVHEKDATRAVRTALDLGINFFDVSPYDGSARAETMLGKSLKGVKRESFILATSVGRHGPGESKVDYSGEVVTREVNASLKRLGVAHIDLVQCHDVEFATVSQIVGETIPALQKLKQQGKVRRIGITGLPLRVFRKVLDKVALDAVQSYCHYCLYDITLVQLFSYLKAHNAGIINAAPFAMNLLTEKGPPAWHPAPAIIRDVCARASEHCRQRKGNLAKLALQFAVGGREIATTLVGTANARSIKDNVKWLDEPIDLRLLAEVLDILSPIRNQSWPSGRPENN
jgi:L-galactose dehydrogenase